jgi:hypothetical protein
VQAAPAPPGPSGRTSLTQASAKSAVAVFGGVTACTWRTRFLFILCMPTVLPLQRQFCWHGAHSASQHDSWRRQAGTSTQAANQRCIISYHALEIAAFVHVNSAQRNHGQTSQCTAGAVRNHNHGVPGFDKQEESENVRSLLSCVENDVCPLAVRYVGDGSRCSTGPHSCEKGQTSLLNHAIIMYVILSFNAAAYVAPNPLIPRPMAVLPNCWRHCCQVDQTRNAYWAAELAAGRNNVS